MPSRQLFLVCAAFAALSLTGHVIADAVCASPDTTFARQCAADGVGRNANRSGLVCALHTLGPAALVTTLALPLSLTTAVTGSKPQAFVRSPARLLQPPKRLTIA